MTDCEKILVIGQREMTWAEGVGLTHWPVCGCFFSLCLHFIYIISKLRLVGTKIWFFRQYTHYPTSQTWIQSTLVTFSPLRYLIFLLQGEILITWQDLCPWVAPLRLEVSRAQESSTASLKNSQCPSSNGIWKKSRRSSHASTLWAKTPRLLISAVKS